VARRRSRCGLLLAVVLAGCPTFGRTPELDPTEHVAGEHHRLVPAGREALWPAMLGALSDGGMQVERSDQAQGTIVTHPVRHATREAPRRFAEIADVAAAHRAGLQHVSEYSVTYYLLLAGAPGGATSVTIRSGIEAMDHRPTVLGGGLFGILPTRVAVPSRGVVERELMRRLAGEMFTAEETLLLLGEPGVD